MHRHRHNGEVGFVGNVVARARRWSVPLIAAGLVAILLTLLVLPLRTWFA